MKSLLIKLCCIVFIIFPLYLQAQTVIQDWATITSNITAKPWSIVTDHSGNIYVQNTNGSISKISQSGVVDIYFMHYGVNAHPDAISTDALGNIYIIMDYIFGTILRINSSGMITGSWSVGNDNQPVGIVPDANGNIFTVNLGNNTISKISADGTVTQAWATLVSGASPSGIAIDASGNLYTTNGGNNTVSKITPDGIVTDAWATTAEMGYALSIDVSGNVYMGGVGTVSNGNGGYVATLTKIPPSGGTNIQPFIAFAGSNSIAGITSDASGNVFAAIKLNNSQSKISKLSPEGTIIQSWPIGTNLGFGNWPITIDGSGNIYTANAGNGTVSKLSSAGQFTETWASLLLPIGPRKITVAPNGNFFIANQRNNTVSKITPSGTVSQDWAILADDAEPVDVVTDLSGNVFTANYGLNTISKITPDGTASVAWATLASNANPNALAVNSSGDIFSANPTNSTISKISANGTTIQTWASLDGNAYPVDIAFDNLGNLFILNLNNHTISKIIPDGTVTQIFAQLSNTGSAYCLAIDASNNIYTANYNNNTLSKITPNGTITDVWAILANNAQPMGISIDASGNIYTANYGNNTISKIAPDGTVTQDYGILAVGANPISVLTDTSENIYTTNFNNNTVSKIIPVPQPGSALNFDGINDYVSIPHNALLKPSSAITIEAWIKPVNIHTNAYSEIYRKEDGNDRHLFSFQNNGSILSFGLAVAGVYSELDVPIAAADYENQWVHVAATFDGTLKKIYRNGILIGSQYVTGTIGTSGTAPACIGSFGGDAEFFNGTIDEFSLWNRALTATEIQDKMNCEINPGSQNGIIALYHFNQGTGGKVNTDINILTDAGSNHLNGTLTNFALNGFSSNWLSTGGVQTGLSCGVPFSLCPSDNFAITSDVSGSQYQWQIKSPASQDWADLLNQPSDYFSTTSATQTISRNNIDSYWTGTQFRCRVDNVNYSSVYTLSFKTQWTGNVSNLWSDAGNWSCSILPDQNTDVIIYNGPVNVNINGACRSIHIIPGVNLTVESGFTLTVTH